MIPTIIPENIEEPLFYCPECYDSFFVCDKCLVIHHKGNYMSVKLNNPKHKDIKQVCCSCFDELTYDKSK